MMQPFSVFNTATGKILRSGYVSSGSIQDQAGEGESVIAEMHNDAEYRIEEGQAVPLGHPPSPHHTFDWAAKQWLDPRTLQDLKDAKNAEINAARLRANQTSFTYQGQQIAVDALSRGDIETTHGVVTLTGALPPQWVGGWKTQANTYVPLPDVAAWTQFYLAMNAQGSLNFAHAQSLKAQLQAAASAEQVATITWDAAT